MKKMLLLTTGAAVGFVLGARAGRPAYDRIAGIARDAASMAGMPRTRDAVQQAGSGLRDTAADLRDSADAGLADTVRKVDDKAESTVSDAAERLRSTGTSRG